MLSPSTSKTSDRNAHNFFTHNEKKTLAAKYIWLQIEEKTELICLATVTTPGYLN
jgi:hypothetical protein